MISLPLNLCAVLCALLRIEHAHAILSGTPLRSLSSNRGYHRFFKVSSGTMKIRKYAVENYIRDLARSDIFVDPADPTKRLLDPNVFTHRTVANWLEAANGKWTDEHYELAAVSLEVYLLQTETLPHDDECWDYEMTANLNVVGGFRSFHENGVTTRSRVSHFRRLGKALIGQAAQNSARSCNYKARLACEEVLSTRTYKCTYAGIRTLNPDDPNRNEATNQQRECVSHPGVLPHYVDFKALLLGAVASGSTPRNEKPTLTVLPYWDTSVAVVTMCGQARPYCSYVDPVEVQLIPYMYQHRLFPNIPENHLYGCLTMDINHRKYFEPDTSMVYNHVRRLQDRFTLQWGAICNRAEHDYILNPDQSLIEGIENLYHLTVLNGKYGPLQFCAHTALQYCGTYPTNPTTVCRCAEESIFYKDYSDREATGRDGCFNTLPWWASCNRQTAIAYPAFLESPFMNFSHTGLDQQNSPFQTRLDRGANCMVAMRCDGASNLNRCKCMANAPVAGFKCAVQRPQLIFPDNDKYIPLEDGTSTPLSEADQIARLRPYNTLVEDFRIIEAAMTIPAHAPCKQERLVDSAMLEIRQAYQDLQRFSRELHTFDELFVQFEIVKQAIRSQNHELCALSTDKNGQLHRTDPILICKFGICRRVDGYDDVDELMIAFESEFRVLHRKGSKKDDGTDHLFGPCDASSITSSTVPQRRQSELDNYTNTYINLGKSNSVARDDFRKKLQDDFMIALRNESRLFCRTELGLSCISDGPGTVPYCGCKADEYVPWDRSDGLTTDDEKLVRKCAIQFSHPCDLCVQDATNPNNYVFNTQFPCSKIPVISTVFEGRGFTIGEDYCLEGSECRAETYGIDRPPGENPAPDARYCRRKANSSRVQELVDQGKGNGRAGANFEFILILSIVQLNNF